MIAPAKKGPALVLAGCMLVVAFAAPVATAAQPATPSPDDARIDKLTDLVVEAVPFGKIFDIAAADPDWPLQTESGDAVAVRRACLREQLSPAGYRRNKRVEVAAYVAANPDRIGEDIALLENGGASIMGMAMMAGVDSKVSGKEIDPQALLATIPQERLAIFLSFLNDEKYLPLRRVAGLLMPIEGDDAEGNTANEAHGAMMAARVMQQAVAHCDAQQGGQAGK